MNWLRQFTDHVGWSDHTLVSKDGIWASKIALALGAKWIERHFTKDRTWKGTDHAASLESAGFSKLTRDLKATYKSLKFKSDEILEIEKPQRKKLKWRA